MARYSWRTDPSGLIIVSDDTGLDNYTPTLTGGAAALMDAAVVDRWADKATVHAMRVMIPVAAILAMIFRESGGNPNITNTEVPPGLGLMQITNPSLYTGLTRAQVLDPEVNLRIGANLIATLAHMLGYDFPKISSGYNAGLNPITKQPHTSSKSPWGITETSGHILSEVSAYNFCIQQGIVAGLPASSADKPKVEEIDVQGVLDHLFNLTPIVQDAEDEARKEAHDQALADNPNTPKDADGNPVT